MPAAGAARTPKNWRHPWRQDGTGEGGWLGACSIRGLAAMAGIGAGGGGGSFQSLMRIGSPKRCQSDTGCGQPGNGLNAPEAGKPSLA